ncbi:hypothetical protein DSCW_30130 [Desulfosarcina widdelii]|uniref:Cyclic nucleotide-binding protein n=1 Tax=Desulfosarcina widdelii TaxID=947919 RepID=A0A5K7Z1N9_9BACT|nr:DUF1003 domain-containing protein [Desulfosarcina widdelii]BBO75596.1 hypothetical protein DSCW_30130 [Desulfosarcina widdelii]
MPLKTSRDGKNKKPVCRICQAAVDRPESVPLALVRPAVLEEIRKDHPDLSTDGFICKDDLNRYRIRYVESLLSSEQGELSTLDRDVLESFRQHEILTSNLNEEFVNKLTMGEALADRIATFGGSWPFIIVFGSVLLVWILINTIFLVNRHFDPYPFILLNLILSCLAAVQAPVIMMSQNRQEAKDRLRSENDYRINLKAELEIRHLNEKVDHLLSRQWERLAEIQAIQLELIAEVAALKHSRD